MQPEGKEAKSEKRAKKEAASEAAKEQFSSTFTENMGNVFAPLSDIPNQNFSSEPGSPERDKMLGFLQHVIDHLDTFTPPHNEPQGNEKK